MTDLSFEKTMTVKEIASALGTAESTIRNKAKELFPNLIRNGIEAQFNEEQVTHIKQNLVPRDLTLKSKLENSVTEIEMHEMTLKVIKYQVEKINILQSENDRMKPKEIVYDQVLSAKNEQDVGDIAKLLGYGRNTFFGMLRDDNILMKSNRPYQSFMKYFKLIEIPVNINGHIENKIVIKVNATGLDYLTKKYGVSK